MPRSIIVPTAAMMRPPLTLSAAIEMPNRARRRWPHAKEAAAVTRTVSAVMRAARRRSAAVRSAKNARKIAVAPIGSTMASSVARQLRTNVQSMSSRHGDPEPAPVGQSFTVA